MTKKNVLIVITEWGRHKNWVYVVLSRVTTRLGLFFLKKFNIQDLEGLEVPRSLKSFETRMRKVEKAFIARVSFSFQFFNIVFEVRKAAVLQLWLVFGVER